jgi:tetratricopeptide (TPR) repeat protein
MTTCVYAENQQHSEAEKLAIIGHKLLKEEHYLQAIHAYRQCLEIEPHAAIYLARAQASSKLNDFDAAVADCGQALELDARCVGAYLLRARMCRSLKDYNRAISDLTKAIDIDDSNAAVYVFRAALWQDLEQYELVIADFNGAIKREPNRIDFLIARAVAWHSLEKWNKLYEDAEKIIALEPGNVLGYLFRAEASSGLGDYAAAHKDYLKALSLDESDLALRRRYSTFLAGCPDQTLRDTDKALQLATQVCEQTKWQDGRALSAIAYAYYALGQFDDAIKWQVDAVKLASAKNKPEAEEWLRAYEARKPIDSLPR